MPIQRVPCCQLANLRRTNFDNYYRKQGLLNERVFQDTRIYSENAVCNVVEGGYRKKSLNHGNVGKTPRTRVLTMILSA